MSNDVVYLGLTTGGDDGYVAMFTGIHKEDPTKEVSLVLDALESLYKKEQNLKSKAEFKLAIRDYRAALKDRPSAPIPPGGIPDQPSLFD